MKNIIIVCKNQNTVAMGDSISPITKSVASTSSFMPSLVTLNNVLSLVPKEPSETVHIYIPDTILAIASGSAIEYVKTGKTIGGNALSAEEIAEFKKFYELYAERILNVRFTQFKYIPKDNAELQALKKKAWDALNSIATTSTVANTAPTTIDPDKAIREKFDAKILEALDNGDMELYAILKAERDKLRPVEVVAGTSVTPSAGKAITPSFDSTDADKAFENASEEENTKPITFSEEASVAQPEW